MIARRQLPVHSPVAAASLLRALARAAHPRDDDLVHVANVLAERYAATRVVLTDSGTSALVLALRLVAGRGGCVALPAYGCIDLTAAARFAGVRVRLYDLDPLTLSADLASLERVLRCGVDAVLVAHLYGHPADVPAIAAMAARFGAPVIEDAAQAAGSRIGGRRAGSFGELSILSFGRGKGTTAGSGGALLANRPEWGERVRTVRVAQLRRSGWRELAGAGAHWLLGRPRLYALPCAVPGLHLGEMVYRPASEPRPLADAPAALLRDALAADDDECGQRRRNAEVLAAAAVAAPGLRLPRAGDDASPGHLRFVVLDDGARRERPSHGIVRGYPMILAEHRELRACLSPSSESLVGARDLVRTLFTAPTHSRVERCDLDAIAAWLRADAATDVPATASSHAYASHA